MKSLEDLNLMTVPMLEKIHLDLTGNKPKKGLTKQQLTQRVFELQQPDPTPPEAPKSDEGATPPVESSAADANDFDDLVGGDEDEPEDAQGDADSLSVNDEEDLIGDEPTPQPKLPSKVDVKVSDAHANRADVDRALAHLPIKVEHDETGLTIIAGSKRIYTTIKQPLHVIVATAEAFAGVR